MSVRFPRWLFLGACFALLVATPRFASAAISSAAPSTLTLQEVEEYGKSGVPEDKWPILLETLGHADEGNAARGLIRELKPFPAERLVKMLTHGRLSVRLGALDVLEDAAGDTFGFDPWADQIPTANVEALQKWQAWAAKGQVATVERGGTLSPETFRVIALEIISGQRERAERATLRLENYGLPAIAHLEAFLHSQQDLAPAGRAALKAAEYRLILRTALPRQAAGLARSLAQGSLEAQSMALAQLGEAGTSALPITADFLESPDPLVRESAVDAAFAAAERHAVPIVLARLPNEKAESVLHAMLRGLGKYIQTAPQSEPVVKLLQHPSENVVISALEAIGAATASPVPPEALGTALNDPRWRVRAAALDAIAHRRMSELKDPVLARLADPDLFVRVSAVTAYASMGSNAKDSVLIEQFEKNHELKASILKVFLNMGQQKQVPEKIWELLVTAPPEVILQCLDTLESRESHDGKHIRHATRFATHPNIDVAAAALRLLSAHGQSIELLLPALESNDRVKQDAVLDGLVLPRGFFPPVVEAKPTTAPTVAPGEPTKVDQLFQAMQELVAPASPATTAPEASAAPATPVSGSLQTRMRAVLDRFFTQGTPQQKLRAAVVLGVAGDQAAINYLLSVYDTLSSLDRRASVGIIHALRDDSPDAQRQYAYRLLRDNADDVREQAIEVWVETATPARMVLLLDELLRTGTHLHPDAIYDWSFARSIGRPPFKAPIEQWSHRVLASDKAPDHLKVFAIVLLSKDGSTTDPAVWALRDSKNPWLRRAAYRAAGLDALKDRLDTVLRDDSAHVRAILPYLASPSTSTWRHYFDDTHHAYDQASTTNFYSSSFDEPSFGSWSETAKKGKSTLAPEVIAAVEKLAQDPSDLVRFEAQFALLALGRPIDPVAFGTLLRLQPDFANAPDRVGEFFKKNYARLGKAYGVLVPLIELDSDERKVLTHFGTTSETPFESFAAIAKLAPATITTADVAIASPTPPPLVPATENEFRVLFFFKPGCRDCDRTRSMLQQLAPSFPRMILQERDISDPRAVVQNEVLSNRFGIVSTLHQVTPSVFTQEGALVREDVNFSALSSLLQRTASAAPKPDWAEVKERETAAAETTIVQRFESFKIGAMMGAGLLDGINPCAFATIIFLLSYLQVARRSPGEILAIGFAFISAVFLTYFVVGLGLAEVLTRMTAMRQVGFILNYVLATFALVVAVLSFRDAQLASRGQAGEMTLQLPPSLKERIRYTIRTSSKSSRFVVAAFAAGAIVSLLELACTGQVYLPTIQYMVLNGRSGAVGYLLLYNLAFILPLVVVFILAWLGFRSEDLIRFQKRHTALVKVLTGILFLLLTAFLLFGHQWLQGPARP